jgi:hypothetical protein
VAAPRKRRSTARPADASAARELQLYIENDGELYRQRGPFLENMRRKMRKGTYDPAKGAKLWTYYVERGARKYVRDLGGSMATFGPATRLAVARELERDARAELRGER